MAAAELAPFVTTGGLGNAVAGLGGALAGQGHMVTVAIPGYRDLGVAGEDRSWQELESQPYRVTAFLDEAAFGRAGVYGPGPGTGYEDNWWRYGRFSEAVAGLSSAFDVLHLHDTHVAAAAVTASVASVLTVHNASSQLGGHLDEVLDILGPGSGKTDPATALAWWRGGANYLKGGIVAADRVTTVSPTHALELTVDETSFGLADAFRSIDPPISGILNGIDTESWDPSTDHSLPARFSARSMARRGGNRRALLERVGLDDGVVFGNVGRMAHQKGLSLVEYHLGSLVSEGFRLVLVGNGELDDVVDAWAADFPGAVAHLSYDEDLARLVSAGADVYLMPSEFEPSGLGQLYTMRYGCPALAFATGGLVDSVIDIDEDPGAGNGFIFRIFNAEAFTKTVRRAMRYRRDSPKLWRELQVRGMKADWSWNARVGEYEAVFEEALAS